MKKSIFILFLIFTTALSAQSKDIQFLREEHATNSKSVWVKEGKSKASYLIKLRGGCCDMPSPELMNAEVKNDTLYIDKAVEHHSNHDKIGICGTTIKMIINTKTYPNYKKFVLEYKELETTKMRRVPNYKTNQKN